MKQQICDPKLCIELLVSLLGGVSLDLILYCLYYSEQANLVSEEWIMYART